MHPQSTHTPTPEMNMLNMTWNSDKTEAYCHAFRANEYTIGERFITNIPGRCGHNYAFWSVTAIAHEPTDNFAPYRITMARQ